LGQAYNRKYWKIPIVWATGAAVGYYVYYNHKNFSTYRKAMAAQLDSDPYTKDVVLGNVSSTPEGLSSIGNRAALTKKNRDLGIIIGFVWYGLNIAEAIADAHLQGFDVSEDLSLAPTFQEHGFTGRQVPSLSFKLRLHSSPKTWGGMQAWRQRSKAAFVFSHKPFENRQ
jgi:hypothetical protein